MFIPGVLACRPMLPFAVAVMGGAIVARRFQEVVAYRHAGVGIFILLAIWFVCTPGKAPLLDPLPDGREAFVQARPGPIARRGLNRFILLFGFGFFLLAVYRQAAWQDYLSPDRLPESRWFDATVIAAAPCREYVGERGPWRVAAHLVTVDGQGVEPVPVRLSGPEGTDFRRGDVLHCRVRRDPLRPKAFPGAFDLRRWLERDGLAATLTVVRPRGKEAPAYEVTAVNDVSLRLRIRRVIDAIRGRGIAATLAYGGEHGGMLAAMLYGYRKDTAAEVRNAFRRVGIGHVLAISGLHVGLIIGILWWISGWSGATHRLRAFACLVLSLAYLGLAGGQVAATRATCMAGIYLAGIAWGRRGDMLNSLGAAAFLLVLANPSAPEDVSFQLSFTAVVFIYLATRRESADHRRRRKLLGSPLRRYLAREAVSLLRLSASTWVGLL
ncbi:MAG: ComEC family competence protein, partial [Planctomycetes bacterium]|nr:ComEC family competence protein [Planctomycetota bacterium]